jgi:electron transfer flavoprotein alpha subunit
MTLLVLGSNVAAAAAQAALLGEQVLVADLPALAEYDPELWAPQLRRLPGGRSHTVLIGGSRSGREYSPRVAVKLDAPLIEDAISLKG